MISVIICSVSHQLLNNIKINIDKTIGLEYEIISIDNKIAHHGICKVYNQGGEKAKYPILCFIHEDILFETQNWGEVIVEHFSDSKVGLIGLAGGDTKGVVPSGWSTSYKSNEVNIIQHNKEKPEISRHITMTDGEVKQDRKRVVALDGVFLCTKKSIFNQFKFDETNFKGFHGYDIDYSLQVFTRYNVVVVFNILVHHFSEGTPDRKWLQSAFTISKKWKRNLPLSVYPLSETEFNFYHWKSLQIFIERLFKLNFKFSQIVYYYFNFSFSRYFKVRRFLSMGKYVIFTRFNKADINKNRFITNINNENYQ